MPVSPPPDQSLLSSHLVRPGSLWSRVEVVPEVPSTNPEVARLARAGAPHGTVLVTDNQTAGRGRFDRTWTTPPGVSLAFSALVRPQVPLLRWPWLSLMAGLAVAQGVRRVSGLNASVKWPNDVLIDERKICGILSEQVSTEQGSAAVIGVGINVSMDADELPVPTATSLLLEGGPVDKSELAVSVLDALGEAYRLWEEDPVALAHQYAENCGSIGRRVRVLLAGDRSVEGLAEGVNSHGALLVRVGDERQPFAAGDVVHLR